MTAARKRQPIP